MMHGGKFRLSGEEFMVLLAELKPYIAQDYTSPNFCALSAEKKLAVKLQSAEYGTFRRDLRCARAKLPVCRCAPPKISGVLVCTDYFSLV